MKKYMCFSVAAQLLLLTGCKTVPPTFTPQQIAAMQQAGFQSTDGSWTLGLSEKILFGSNKSVLRAETRQRIDLMAQHFSQIGLKHFRMDGHTDNYGTPTYNQMLSLRRANVVADEWAAQAQIPASNITVRGLGDKYPITTNQSRAGRAENRRVAIVISTP